MNLLKEELEFIEFLKDKNIQTFVDVGANCGEYTMKIVEELNPQNIFMYEPISALYEDLTLTFPFATVKNLIVSDSQGEVEFNEALNNRALSSCVNRDWLFKDMAMQKSMKRCVALENEGYDQIDLLKIDTEGFELKVLMGCQQLLLEEKIRYIQFEYGGCFKDFGVKLINIINYVNALGYKVYKLENGIFTEITDYQDDYKWINYFIF
jgi:FkbM family methyltransferase